jgi:predicted  nucleic acid-binding Zn-ribbon protein
MTKVICGLSLASTLKMSDLNKQLKRLSQQLSNRMVEMGVVRDKVRELESKCTDLMFDMENAVDEMTEAKRCIERAADEASKYV